MNVSDREPCLEQDEDMLQATLSRFSLENFKNLSQIDLLLAQTMLGHGSKWGVWETSSVLFPGRVIRIIDFTKRLRHNLSKEEQINVSPDRLNALVEEGVLILTRLALLLRLAPSSARKLRTSKRLKPSTISQILFFQLSKISARAIRRKAICSDVDGLLECLTEDDIQEFAKNSFLCTELERMDLLAGLGLWTDLPPHPDIMRTTDPSGPKFNQIQQKIRGEYKPIPDEYLAEFGPRNLWLICEMGPNLLRLLEELISFLKKQDWSSMTKDKMVGGSGLIVRFISTHLCEHPWRDKLGRPLKPSFPLITSQSNAKDLFEWPPRHYEHLKILSASLQSAHLFLTLLATAGRIGEIQSLSRSCVMVERDGRDYVHGWTYKLSGKLLGDARQWVAPSVLVQALGQQVRLANMWSRMPSSRVEGGPPVEHSLSDSLWLSLGTSVNSKVAEPLKDFNLVLPTLAKRIGMDPKPGGINLHPHRCRKTIGRLAGVSLFKSPLVLKRLFGHKSIEMVLHYILCNKDIRNEAEVVLRELRIMHCAQTLEDVREALVTGNSFSMTGKAAHKLEAAVKEYEDRLTKSERIWSDGSAYDLAYILTSSGQGWRFIQKNIICAKVPGEIGLCRNSKGEPNTASCKPECDNRIVLAVKRRNVGEVVECYIDVASQALDEEQYMVFYESMQRLMEELDAYPDIKAQFFVDCRMQPLFEAYEELIQ